MTLLTCVMLLAAPSIAGARQTWAEADNLQRQAVDRWVARDFAEADRLYGEALAAFEAIGDREMVANCLANRALIRLNLERWDAAAGDARRAGAIYAAAIAAQNPNAPGANDTNSPLNLARRGRAGALGALRSAAVARGQLEEAEQLQREQIALWEAVGDENPTGLATGYEGLAEIVEAAGRHAEAAEHYDRAAALWQRSSEVYASDFVAQRRLAALAGARAARGRVGSGAATVARASSETPAEPEASSGESDSAATPEAASTADLASHEGAAPGLAPAASEPAAQTPGLDPLELVGRAVSLVGPALMPLVFGGIVLMVLISGARQRKRTREAVLQHRATDALRKPRPAIVGAPAREQPAAGRQGPVTSSPPRPQTTDVDLPPPVVGGAGRAVIEHKGTGWCGCLAAAALIAGLAALIPWLLRTLDVL